MQTQIDEFSMYLKEVKKTSDNTIIAYRRDLKRMADYMAERGVEDASLVTIDNLSDYANSLREEYFSPASVTRHYTSIKAFFRYLVENGNI